LRDFGATGDLARRAPVTSTRAMPSGKQPTATAGSLKLEKAGDRAANR
jgi:hypothetical protein